MKGLFTKKFIKQYNKLSARSQRQFDNRLRLFVVNLRHNLLRRHALKGKYANHYSINIRGDLRAIFKYRAKDQVIFQLIGTQAQLY